MGARRFKNNRVVDLADYEGPEHYVRAFDGFMSAAECEFILKAFHADKEGQFQGKTMGGYDPDMKVTTDLRVGPRMRVHPQVWRKVDAILFRVVSQTWTKYLDEVPGAHRLRGPFEDTGYQIQHYTSDVGCFRPHCDSSGWQTAFRCGSCVIYLSTVTKGGGTRFPVWGFRVPAVQARVCWFPPNFDHEHEGEIPLGQTKTIVSTFMCFKGYGLMCEGGPLYEHFLKAQDQ